jgi:microcystin-dependent protein
MATPFLGELKLVPFDFAPTGWAFCNGQLLSIAQNTALFALLGTQYGGDGHSFALPNYRGCPARGRPGYIQGQAGGASTVQLTLRKCPRFTCGHGLEYARHANVTGERRVGAGFRWNATAAAANVTMSAAAIGTGFVGRAQ